MTELRFICYSVNDLKCHQRVDTNEDTTSLMTQCSVCGSKGSTLISTDELDATQQARFQEQHAEKPTGFLLCTLCVRYLQPAPFFAKKTATSSEPGTNVGTNEGSVSSVSSAAKKTKPDQPKTPGEKKHVAKHVTVDQRVEKYGKYGLCNNNNLLMCKCCGKKVDHQREDSIRSHITTPLHDQNCESTYVPVHRMCWHQATKTV